jgi:hypothetical protein
MTVVKAKKKSVMEMTMPPQPWCRRVERAAMVYSTPGRPRSATLDLTR